MKVREKISCGVKANGGHLRKKKLYIKATLTTQMNHTSVELTTL